MSERIIVINASPRKGGNDDLLCDAFVKGATEAGKQVRKIEIVDYIIKPCYACGYCIEHPGNCAQKDDWAKLYQLLEDSDAVVFSTPLYYGSVSAWLKIVFERFYMQRLKPIKGLKKAGFMCVCADQSKGIMDTAYDCFKRWLSCMDGIKEAGVILAPGFGGKGEIKDSVYLQEGKEFGRRI